MAYNYKLTASESIMELDPLSDNFLMLKVRDGDLQKLSLLFERYKNMLFAYFIRLSKDRESSEDLVQMVFIKVIKYKHSYRGDGGFKPWIFHIARNLQADQWRKDKRRGYKVSTDVLDQTFREEPSTLTKEENLTKLEVALDRLPKETKELLVLAKIKGMRYKEISQLMEWTESNVKIKVFRAIRLLKEQYELIERTQQ